MEPSQRGQYGPPAVWLPAYLALLLAAAFTPLSYSSVAGPIWWSPLPWDVLANVLAYLPLGWALGRRRTGEVLAMGLLLSVGVEVAQRYMLRTPSPWDVAANLAGAWLGASLFARLGPLDGLTRYTRGVALLALPLALVLLAWLAGAVARAPVSVPASWQQGTLWIGHSSLADAPLTGRLRELRVFDRFPRSLGRSWSSGGPILRLDASARSLTLDGPAGRRTLPWPVGLAAEGSSGASVSPTGVRLPRAAAEHVLARARASGSLAVWASFDEPPPPRGRAAALFALIDARGGGLFTLLRDAPGVALRVPVPGELARSFGPGALLPVSPPEPHGVLASYDGHWARVVVDGSLGHQSYLPSRLSPWPIGSGVTLSSVLVVLLAAVGAGRLWPVARGRRAAMLAAGAGAHAGLWAIGLLPLHAGPISSAVVSGLAALAALPLTPLIAPAKTAGEPAGEPVSERSGAASRG
jgi:hypothetical protein